MAHPTTCPFPGIPAGSPTCMAAATKHDEYVMLRCRWEGGTPPATLRWWDGRGRALGVPTPSATVLVLSTDTSLRGQDFVCVAAHPLRAASTECRLRLGKRGGPRVLSPLSSPHAGRRHATSSPSQCADVPELEVERGEVAVLEGGEARLACRQRGGTELGAEMGWYDPQEREVPAGTTKYRLERGGAWANLTVRDAEWPQDGGTYRCAAANSVGTASLPVRLRVDRESQGRRHASPCSAGRRAVPRSAVSPQGTRPLPTSPSASCGTRGRAPRCGCSGGRRARAT